MTKRVRVSGRWRWAVVQARFGRPQYQIAKAAGLHPVVLSSLLHDARPVQPDDPRVIAVGRIVGVPPSECFEVIQEPGLFGGDDGDEAA